jgi:hypothetical protein
VSEPAAPSGPVTATGTAPANVDGQAIAITVFSAVKPLGRLWLPLVFWFATTFPRASGTLARLSFIHSARWTLIRKIPFNGPPQRQEKLNYPHLFFESNFNGPLDPYLDELCVKLAPEARDIWGRCVGCPPEATGPQLKAYLLHNKGVPQAPSGRGAVPKGSARRGGLLCRWGRGAARGQGRRAVAQRHAAGLLSFRHRIIRRRVPYGPPLPAGVLDDDGVDQGLVFACFNASISRQFESVQLQWPNDGNGFRLGHDSDFLCSAARSGPAR